MSRIGKLGMIGLAMTLLFTAVDSTRSVFAQQPIAQRAAEDIIRSLADGKFNDVWNQKVSKFTHDNTSMNAFLSYMVNHAQFGILQDLKYVSSTHFDQDQATGYRGDIYTVIFRNTYSRGEFFEYLTVVKDSDGQYRFSGYNSARVP